MRRILFLFLLLTAASAQAEWRRIAPGVEFQRITQGQLEAFVAKVDLRSGKLRVIASELSDRGMKVSDFAKKHHAIIAINADYFDEKEWPIGLAAGACGVWTKGQKVPRKEGLVGIGRRRVEIQQNTMNKKRWMSGAVAGWPLLNQHCAPITELPGSDHFTRAPHPRTAVGLSKDGKTMYIVVAEGRQEEVPGPTLPELAIFMDELGACTAMNLDGGGSSAMWVENAIVNTPSDGFERNVGNHLAIIAADDYKGCTK